MQNGLSLLQVQDGALTVAGSIVDRISELRTMAEDVTKNGDIENSPRNLLNFKCSFQGVPGEV